MADFDRKTERFLSFCSDNGVNHRLTDKGVRFRDCPNCSSSKYKPYMFLDGGGLLGSCAKCGFKFSAKSFLLESGFEESEILEAVGLDISMEMENTKTEQKQEINPNEVPTIIKPNHWISIEDDPELLASKYALKRHVTEPLFSRVMIDTQEDGVVFIVTDTKNREIGWQVRYRVPKNPKMKTKTMPGFKCHENLFFLINKKNPLVLCEGPMDSIASYKLGYSTACFFGSNPSIAQMNIVEYLLLYYSIPKVIVCFDQDEPGIKASLKSASFLEENNIEYSFGIPEAGKDISESLDVGKGITLSDSLNVENLIFTNIEGKTNAYQGI